VAIADRIASHVSSVVTKFEDLPLSASMLDALRAVGYEKATPIQAATIAPALEGRDIVGAAQTGTGKTAAFLIPLIERMHAARARGEAPVALILSPTRELAEQIHTWAERLGPDLDSALILGGMKYEPQIKALHNLPSLIIATPGRLYDHLEQRVFNLDKVTAFVLDEADRMLDMGFRPQVDRIIRMLPKKRQTMLFSATLTPVRGIISQLRLDDPFEISVGTEAQPPSKVEQDVYVVSPLKKMPVLTKLVEGRHENWSCLIFTRTKNNAEHLYLTLRRLGYSVERLHADRNQTHRRAALDAFRDGSCQILIATDIAARGIDIDDIRLVINYDMPQTVEDYVHRIGRTARAGTHGHATSFAGAQDLPLLHRIERHLGIKLPRRNPDDPTITSSMSAA
jgi:ATP-dependent RNA helicase RhlE